MQNHLLWVTYCCTLFSNHGRGFWGITGKLSPFWGVCHALGVCWIRIIHCTSEWRYRDFDVCVWKTQFGMFSLFIKERLYLGEAPLAAVFGIIVGTYYQKTADDNSLLYRTCMSLSLQSCTLGSNYRWNTWRPHYKWDLAGDFSCYDCSFRLCCRRGSKSLWFLVNLLTFRCSFLRSIYYGIGDLSSSYLDLWWSMDGWSQLLSCTPWYLG